MAPKIIEHHVHSVLRTLAAKRGNKSRGFLIERNDFVSAPCNKLLELIRIAPAGNHPPRAQTFRDLYRQTACNAGRPQYQNALAGRKVSAHFEGYP